MLQVRIGWAFSILAGLTLLFSAFFDHSPQALFNIIENSSMLLLFILSTVYVSLFFKTLQILAILAGAFISFRLSETPLFGVCMITFAIFLLYAYGGYKTFTKTKVLISILIIFALSFLAISDYMFISLEAIFKSTAWTAFISIFLFLQWIVLKDNERRFQEETVRSLIKQNRQLLELSKELAGGCKDGDSH